MTEAYDGQQIVGMDLGRGAARPKRRHVVIGVPQRPAEAPELQRPQLVLGCGLDRLELVFARRAIPSLAHAPPPAPW